MKFSTVLMLATAAILLGLAACFVSRSSSPQPPGLADWNTPLLKGVTLTGLASVTVSESDRTVSLTLSNGSWCVQNRYNYPADANKLRLLLDNIRKATLVEAVDIEPALRNELGLADGQGTRLTLSDATGTPLFDCTAGLVHQKKSDDPSMAMFGGFPDGRYVLLGNTAYLISDTLDAMDDGPAQWLDKDFPGVPPDELASLAIDGPGREPIRLTREAANGTWKLDGMPAGKELDADRLSRLTSVFTGLSFDDLAEPGAPDSTTGLSTGVVFTAVSTNGVAVALHLGNPAGAGKSRYARVVIRGPDPLPEKTDAQARRVTPWIYTIDDYSTEPLFYTRDQLLADPKKTEGAP